MTKTFEEYLMLIHAGEHIGTKETLVDGFDDWLGELEVDEIIGYADKALALQKKELLEKMLEEFDEFTIAKSWELDKDKFYIYATPEEIKSVLEKELT